MLILNLTPKNYLKTFSNLDPLAILLNSMIRNHIQYLKRTSNQEILSDSLVSLIEELFQKKSATNLVISFVYSYNSRNLWGFVFCGVNKKTSLNTFISIHISDTVLA